jgi:hypothetical protein
MHSGMLLGIIVGINFSSIKSKTRYCCFDRPVQVVYRRTCVPVLGAALRSRVIIIVDFEKRLPDKHYYVRTNKHVQQRSSRTNHNWYIVMSSGV